VVGIPLCLSQARTWISNVIWRGLFYVLYRSGKVILSTIVCLFLFVFSWSLWKEGIINDDRQFHQYQEKEQPPLTSIRVKTKLPNTEQSSKGKGKTHKSTNRQNQSTTGIPSFHNDQEKTNKKRQTIVDKITLAINSIFCSRPLVFLLFIWHVKLFDNIDILLRAHKYKYLT
jgi:hypothetical protein